MLSNKAYIILFSSDEFEQLNQKRRNVLTFVIHIDSIITLKHAALYVMLHSLQ